MRLAVFHVVVGAMVLAAALLAGKLLLEITRQAADALDSLSPSFLAMKYLVNASALGACGLAVALLRQATRPAARALAMFLAFSALSCLTFYVVTFNEPLTGLTGLARRSVFLVMAGAPLCFWLAVAAFLRFTALLSPSVVQGGPGGWRQRVFRAGLRPSIVWPTALLLSGPFYLGWIADRWQSLSVALIAGTSLPAIIVSALLGVAYLRSGYLHASQEERPAILWVLAGFFVSGAVLLVATALATLSFFRLTTAAQFVNALLLFSLPLPITVVFLAVAMFYHGAVDPRLAMRRSAVFGLMAASMILVFDLVANLAEELLSDGLGLPRWSGMLVATLALAMVFGPLRARLEDSSVTLLAKLFPPAPDDATRIREELGPTALRRSVPPASPGAGGSAPAAPPSQKRP